MDDCACTPVGNKGGLDLGMDSEDLRLETRGDLTLEWIQKTEAFLD